MRNLQEIYKKEVVPKLAREFALRSSMAVPKVVKVVVNMGIGDIRQSKDEVEKVSKELAALTGQRPSFRVARISVAGFGVRRGQTVGLSVTLRGRKMYDFLQKLFAVTLPRVRDFRGINRGSFDGGGSYTLGIAEHTVFPEVDLGSVSQVRGLEVTIVTSAKGKRQAERLLEELGMPFEKKEQEGKRAGG